MRGMIRIDDFTPEESEIFRKLAEHAVAGRKLERAGVFTPECQRWLDKGTNLVAELAKDPDRFKENFRHRWHWDYDERTAPGLWEREVFYHHGTKHEPKTESEFFDVFKQAVAAAERIAKSPAVPVSRRATWNMTPTDASRLRSKLVSKVGARDVEFLILGKKLRNVLLLLRALDQDAPADGESGQGLQVATVAQAKELTLELFDLARSSSVVHLLLFEYDYPSLGDSRDQTLVKLAQVELAILEMAGLDAPAREDFVRFMHHECSEELERLAEAGLRNTRETLYSLGARSERSVQLRPLTHWIELVTGSSVMAWNLALVSSLSLSTAEWSGLVGKFLAALALWGKGVRDLTTDEK